MPIHVNLAVYHKPTPTHPARDCAERSRLARKQLVQARATRCACGDTLRDRLARRSRSEAVERLRAVRPTAARDTRHRIGFGVGGSCHSSWRAAAQRIQRPAIVINGP
jgi:hypothetical protein